MYCARLTRWARRICSITLPSNGVTLRSRPATQSYSKKISAHSSRSNESRAHLLLPSSRRVRPRIEEGTMREGNDEHNNQQIVTSSRRRWIMLVAILFAVGTSATTLWLLRGTDRSNRAGLPVPTPDFDVVPPSDGGAAPHPGDLLITIQPDKLENAHFKIEAAITLSGPSINTSVLRTTGTVEPNAYKVVPVMP